MSHTFLMDVSPLSLTNVSVFVGLIYRADVINLNNVDIPETNELRKFVER